MANAAQTALEFLKTHPKTTGLIRQGIGVTGGLALCIFGNRLTGPPTSSNWYFLWLVGAVLCVLIGFGLEILSFRKPDERARVQSLINGLLEATTRALMHPHREETCWRAQCHLDNRDERCLVPFAQWSFPYAGDATLKVYYDLKDSDVFVINRALKQKRIIPEDLPDDHSNLYVGPHAGKVWEELRSVLAVPILNWSDPTDHPIGVISFDSSKELKRSHLNMPHAQEFAKCVSQLTYTLLRELNDPIQR